AVADLVETAAAVGFRIAHAEQAQFAPAPEDVPREDLGLLGFVDERGQLVAAEPPHGVAHRVVLGGEAEVEAHDFDRGIQSGHTAHGRAAYFNSQSEIVFSPGNFIYNRHKPSMTGP